MGAAPAAAAATNRTSVADYQVTTWNTAQGLPHPSVLALAQTPDGYIWCGTEVGLARFDGVRFTVFDSQSTPELGNGQIRSLYTDRQGTLWITTRDGRLVRFADRTFTAFIPPWRDSLNRAILNLVDDEDGSLWLMPEDLVMMRFTSGHFDAGAKLWPQGPSKLNIRLGFDGSIWMTTTENVLARREHGQANIVLQGSYGFHGPSRTGGFWISTQSQMGLWRNGTWLWQGAAQEFKSRHLFQWGAEDNRTRLWLASFGDGVFGFDTNGVVLHFTARDGLASDYTRFVLADREDNVWVATENGLSRIQPALFRTYDRRQGLGADRVTGVCPATEGGLWVGTDGGGLHRLVDGSFSEVTNGPALPLITAVRVDSASNVWVATRGSGLYRSTGRGFERVSAAPVALEVSALFEDSRRRLWVGQRALNTLAQMSADGTWRGLTLPNPELIADVRCFAEDEAGGIWAGTCGNGLFRWDGNQWGRFTRTNGLPSNLIQTLHFDREDHALWVGTAGGGLARWKNARFVVCGTAGGLWDNTICQMFDDGLGWFWFGSRRGVFRVSKNSLRQFMDGELARIHSTAYGERDGLPTLACSGGVQPSGCRTTDGRLWFATMHGLACIDPATVAASAHPPIVRIEHVSLDGEEVRETTAQNAADATAPAFQIPPGLHRCEFQYTGLSLTAPEAVQFKHRLEGLEREWIEAGVRRSAIYSRLPPGDYRFLVTAANRDGIWSQAEAALPFRVLPAFWQTGWFTLGWLATGTASLVTTGWLVARRRARRSLAESAQAHALERERTRIAKDIHDDLGSGLTHIAWLSNLAVADVARPDQVQVHTRKIAAEAHQLVQSLDETVWAVSPENDTLESLVRYVTGYANERLQPMEINCRIEAPDDLRRVPLSAETRHDLYLAIKEALNNLVEHAAARNVRIALGLQNGSLVVSVEDDGRGFDPAQAPVRGGHGWDNMRSRLEQHGGEFLCDTAPGRGTRLTFRLPIRQKPVMK
jgi:signal transduction histidine kinase/ligand-binding sensor domain-containing protein